MAKIVLPPSATRRDTLMAGAALAGTLTAPKLGWTETFDLQEGYVDSGDVRLFYRRAGEGPLMLCLHGHPHDGLLYFHQMREFSTDHLVVAPNLRGYRPSDQPETVEAYSTPHLLRDIHRLIDHFDQERCILVANDWGGWVAWIFASAYPERVERLVILNQGHPKIFLREVRENPVQIKASQYELEIVAATAPYPAYYNYYKADPIRVPASLADVASIPMPDLAAHFFKGLDDDYPPATTSLDIRVPTLAIWGMIDPVVLPGQLDGLEEYVADLTVHRIEDAGHLPMEQRPDEVNRVMRRFLSRD